MKKYRVNFYSTNAEVEAENEEKAIEKAKALFYDGELYCEVEDVEELKKERFCVKCGKTSGLLEEEDICYTCAKERGRI